MTPDEKRIAILKVLSRDPHCKPTITDAKLLSRVVIAYPELENDQAWDSGQAKKILDSIVSETSLIHTFENPNDGILHYVTTQAGDEYITEVYRKEHAEAVTKIEAAENTLTPMQMLDKVLEWMSMNPNEFRKDKNPRINLSQGAIQGGCMVDFPELKTGQFLTDFDLILKKLVKDEYIDESKRTQFGMATMTVYSINFNGKYFSKDGGYQNEKNEKMGEEESEIARMKRLTYATWSAGVAGFCLVSIEILKNFHWVLSIQLVTYLSVFGIGVGGGIIIYKLISNQKD